MKLVPLFLCTTSKVTQEMITSAKEEALSFEDPKHQRAMMKYVKELQAKYDLQIEEQKWITNYLKENDGHR